MSVDEKVVEGSCARLDIDAAGFDEMDRRILRILCVDYEGGPVGVETIAAALGEPRDTIEDVYEPFLLQQGFLGRTPRGRIATKKAWEHLGLEAPHAPKPSDLPLFETDAPAPRKGR